MYSYRWSDWPRCRHLIASHPPETSRVKKVLNLPLGLVTSCCTHQTAWWRPACGWLGWGSMSTGDRSKSHQRTAFSSSNILVTVMKMSKKEKMANLKKTMSYKVGNWFSCSTSWTPAQSYKEKLHYADLQHFDWLKIFKQPI